MFMEINELTYNSRLDLTCAKPDFSAEEAIAPPPGAWYMALAGGSPKWRKQCRTTRA